MSPLRLDPADDPQAWDDYVSAMPGVCAFHSRTWKQALSAAFPQYRPADAFLVRGDDRIGAWSGCVFTPAPFVSFAESSPWHLYGGPVGVAPEDLLDAVACWESCSRRDRACALSLTLPPGDFAASHGVLTEIGFALTEPKHTHVLDLPSDADTLWSGYKGSVRTDVRKATGAGVTVRPVHGDAEIGAFYAVYRATMDRFGSVSKPRSMVADLARSSIATLFMAERAGILNWAIQGAVEWAQNGLQDPEVVLTATREYRDESDVVGNFLEECTHAAANGKVSAKALYAAYRRWCDAYRETALKQKSFGARLTERGLERERSGAGMGYAGIGLQDGWKDG